MLDVLEFKVLFFYLWLFVPCFGAFFVPTGQLLFFKETSFGFISILILQHQVVIFSCSCISALPAFDF